jgi:hypothetical protein
LLSFSEIISFFSSIKFSYFLFKSIIIFSKSQTFYCFSKSSSFVSFNFYKSSEISILDSVSFFSNSIIKSLYFISN